VRKLYDGYVVGSFMSFFRLISAEVDTGSQFTWNTSDGAILHLPNGASRLTCLSNLLRSYAMTHALSWYTFAVNNLHRSIPNGSLYLITGTDKTSSWMVGAFSGAPAEDQVSLRLRPAGAHEGTTSYSYFWATASAPVYRTGPGNNIISRSNQRDLDDIRQDDALFQSDAPDEQNQCVFVRGYRMMLNYTLTASAGIQSVAEVLPIVDSCPEDISAKTSSNVPHAVCSSLPLVSGWSGGASGNGQRNAQSLEGSGQDEILDDTREHEVMLQSVPGHSEVSIYMILSWTLSYSTLEAISSINYHQQTSLGVC
jgi:hypothetical protein